MKKIAIAITASIVLIIAAVVANDIYHAYSDYSDSSTIPNWQQCSIKYRTQYCSIGENQNWMAFFDTRGNTITYVGAINSNFSPVVTSALKLHPKAIALGISSSGGDINAAVKVAAELNKRHMTVLAVDKCASACSVLWSASDLRDLAPGTRIGFHAGRAAYLIPRTIKRLFNISGPVDVYSIYKKAGFTDAEIRTFMETPHTGMFWLKEQQLNTKLTARAQAGAT